MKYLNEYVTVPDSAIAGEGLRLCYECGMAVEHKDGMCRACYAQWAIKDMEYTALLYDAFDAEYAHQMEMDAMRNAE